MKKFWQGWQKVPYNAEELAKEYGARYEKAFIPFAPYVVQDGKLITGQNRFQLKDSFSDNRRARKVII